jgi:hypothetical protein
LDSAVAGHLKEHLRTLQAPFITSNKRSLSSSESSVNSTHPILNTGPTSPYIHRQIISFSTLHQRGPRSQDPPFSSLNFKLTIRPNPSPPKNLIPKHQQSPMSRNGARHRSFDDDRQSGALFVTRWHGRGALARKAILGNMLLARRGIGG